MKNMKPVLLVLMLLAVSISCRLFTRTSSDHAPAVDFGKPAKPLNVSMQLDKTHTASGKVLPTGGSLSLTAADGSVFTLEVPAKALDADTMITMTAVKSIIGAPLADGTLAAVQLEPSGLLFKEIVTLTILPAKEIPINKQIIFGYEGSGEDYHLAVVGSKKQGCQN